MGSRRKMLELNHHFPVFQGAGHSLVRLLLNSSAHPLNLGGVRPQMRALDDEDIAV